MFYCEGYDFSLNSITVAAQLISMFRQKKQEVLSQTYIFHSAQNFTGKVLKISEATCQSES